MSRQHVLTIAESSATAFLFGDERRGVARVKVFRGRSRGGATTITTTEPEAPANTHWVERRAMKRAR